ncbi:MAG: PorT family protein [Prevotellaceae bacterium]|jgi:hypothetical protein|nr:PorT family protein [Prevotellaceae bacterium]
MKRVIPILLLAALAAPATAQIQVTELHLLHYDYMRKWRFGFTIGGHVFDYAIANSEKPVYGAMTAYDGTVYPGGAPLMAEVTTPGTGFNINGIVDYRLIRNWHLRSGFGICFGQRDVNFYRGENGPLMHTSKYDSYYIEVPLLLKFSANRHSNFRPYVVAGTAARYNLSGQVNLAKGVVVGTTPFEPFYEGGFGFDWFYYYFKLSFEVKYAGGLVNVKSRHVAEGFEPYADAITRMNSRMVLFSFHFE